VRNALDVWSEYGWTRAPAGAAPYGYSIRRERLDPLVRATAAATPGVTLLSGWTVRDLCRTRRRITGVVAHDRAGGTRVLQASLVVGADGRHSAVATLAGVPERRRANRRALYYAYHRGLPVDRVGRMWFHDGDASYAYPNDDGLVVLATAVSRERLAAFKRDPDAGLTRAFDGLPEAPRFAAAARVSPVLGQVDAPNVRRRVAYRGLALVGDAAMASDPLWAVGCGWAFQSAAWLVDATAPALRAGRGMRAALAAYRRRHRRELLGHHLLIASFAGRRAFLPHERLLLAAAPIDRVVAERLQAFGERLAPAQRLFGPRLFLHAWRVRHAAERTRSGLTSGQAVGVGRLRRVGSP
jgi:menaquinone-9 beta-reductase